MDCEAKEKPEYNMATYDILNLYDGLVQKCTYIDRPWKKSPTVQTHSSPA